MFFVILLDELDKFKIQNRKKSIIQFNFPDKPCYQMLNNINTSEVMTDTEVDVNKSRAALTSYVELSSRIQQKCFIFRHTHFVWPYDLVWSSQVLVYPYNSLCSPVGWMRCKASNGTWKQCIHARRWFLNTIHNTEMKRNGNLPVHSNMS